MVIVWTMAAVGVVFTFALAAARAAEEKRFVAVVRDGDRH